ncbi:SSI family serine proteinase inhibitor [Streptomyces sp. I05A-00742]|uniref:SSI family serine proteinase inhibitor n=1 Tax=Streptomyces sp. I05A-00742 TaxID=2732853 RepID=UPI001489E6B3|nr:SSI family serine proteinase inhibitor [Streptomyces sp. I05A-00742]
MPLHRPARPGRLARTVRTARSARSFRSARPAHPTRSTRSARSVFAAAVLVPLLLPLFAAPSAVARPLPFPPGPDAGPGPGDHLTVLLTDSGRRDGQYELRCHPAYGTVPDAQGACDQLDGQTRWDRDLFAPVPSDAQCTMVYGGPEHAHVFGTWAGRPVDTDFSRVNGCEMARWNRFSRLLGDPERPSGF